jgi:integrase
VSAFLSAFLGAKSHPFRLAVVNRIPITTEVSRVPDVTPAVFWNVVKHVPKPYQSCFIALAATGMRLGEYLACTRFSLKPATFSVSVPGTKTSGSSEDVVVHPKLWPHVTAAIPAPIQAKALRRYWKAACAKTGVDVRIHDLRHCYGQWAVDQDVPEAKVQSALRHGRRR